MISEEEVKKIAKLARLELTEEEVKKMQKDLSSILDYFNLLSEADVSGIKKETGFADLEEVSRIDEAESFSEADDILKQAPQKEGRFFKVREILK